MQKRRKNQDFRVFVIFQHFDTLNFNFEHREQPLTILILQSRSIITLYILYEKKHDCKNVKGCARYGQNSEIQILGPFLCVSRVT